MKLQDLPPPPPGRHGWPWTVEPEEVTQAGRSFPHVTVVTPSFNQAVFLEETLRSVLLQNYPNLEYIVLDGGSSDDSPAIINKYARHLAYWTSAKDNGAADAIAEGFRRATGSILAYLNSDDPYAPGAIHAVVAAFQRHRDADVVFGNTYWTDAAGNVLAERRQTPFWPPSYLYGGTDLQQPSMFWRRAIYDRAGGMDPSFVTAFDTDLFTRFVAHGARFRYIPRFLSSFRLHAEAKSSTLTARRAEELERIRTAHLKYPFHSMYGRTMRNLGRVHRGFWYTLQGDLPWLLSRVPDRLAARRGDEPVGPRSRNI